MALIDKYEELTVFGSEKHPWTDNDWTASDDRVRGGKSQSYLKCTNTSARFYGTLDISTLGGPGFASQRTTGDDREWNLHDYAGIQLNIAKGDKKRYTFILKDELLPANSDNGREQATISYECDFDLPPQAEPGDTKDRSIFIPWKSFNATYRGKVKKDANPLNTKKIKRISFMMRGFFGAQEGDFSLTISSVKALKKVPTSIYVVPPSLSIDAIEDGVELHTENDVMRFKLDTKFGQHHFVVPRQFAQFAFAMACTFVAIAIWAFVFRCTGSR